MSVFNALIQRASQPKLIAPGPTQQQLTRWLQAGLNAPDHGRLKPWRYWVIEGDQLQSFGKVLAKACAAANPESTQQQLERTRALPLRAPMIIVAAAHVTVDHKSVPPWEQWCAVAAGVQSMQLAIQADGMGCMWRTGELANHPIVKAAFELTEQDQIIGFLYVGTPESPAEARSAPAIEAPFVRRWKAER